MDPSGNPNRFRVLRVNYGVREAKKPHKSGIGGTGERSLPIDRVETEMENPKSHQTPNLTEIPSMGSDKQRNPIKVGLVALENALFP